MHGFDQKKYRKAWLGGVRQHVAHPALGEKLKAKYGKGHDEEKETAIEEAFESPEEQAREDEMGTEMHKEHARPSVHGMSVDEEHESPADEAAESPEEQAHEMKMGTEMHGTASHGSPLKGGDHGVSHDSCPHCGSPMMKHNRADKKKHDDYGMDDKAIALLIRARGE
jgi:hypothetical protein